MNICYMTNNYAVKCVCTTLMVLHLLTLNLIWQMQFNVNKCSTMSIGKGNRSVDYTLNDTTLGRSYSVRDLEVQASSDLGD